MNFKPHFTFLRGAWGKKTQCILVLTSPTVTSPFSRNSMNEWTTLKRVFVYHSSEKKPSVPANEYKRQTWFSLCVKMMIMYESSAMAAFYYRWKTNELSKAINQWAKYLYQNAAQASLLKTTNANVCQTITTKYTHSRSNFSIEMNVNTSS